MGERLDQRGHGLRRLVEHRAPYCIRVKHSFGCSVRSAAVTYGLLLKAIGAWGDLPSGEAALPLRSTSRPTSRPIVITNHAICIDPGGVPSWVRFGRYDSGSC